VLSWKAHQVDFHEVDRAADAAATFSQVTVAIGGFEFVGRAEEFEHGNQAAGGIANLDPAIDLFVQSRRTRIGSVAVIEGGLAVGAATAGSFSCHGSRTWTSAR